MAFQIETVCADIIGRQDFERVTDMIYIAPETNTVCVLGNDCEAVLIRTKEEQ